MKKFNSIYSQLTGKKFQSKSPSDVYYEEKYFEKVLQCEVLNAFFSFCSILSNNLNNKSVLAFEILISRLFELVQVLFD